VSAQRRAGAGGAAAGEVYSTAVKEGQEGAAARILVVDDDPDLAELLRVLLAAEGWRPVSARTAEEAIDVIAAERPDVALVDFMLPDANGLDLMRRALAIDPELACLAVTGQGSERVAVEIMKAGAIDYITKPFENAEVVAAVRRALDERSVRTSPSYRALARDLADKNLLLERQMAELQRRAAESAALAEAGRVLASRLDLEEVLACAMRLAGEFCGAHASSVRLLDEADDRLHLAAHLGLGERYVSRGPVRLGESVCGAAALSREAIHVATAATDPRLASTGLARAEGIASLLCLPLVMRGRCIGVITFYHRAPRRYADDEMQFLAAFAGTVSIAIDNARLYAEQSRLAVTDGLTGLFNHRRFQEALAAEIARARRYAHPVSLVLVDIDHFKRYNDANGHQAGDALLHELAALLRHAARENDLVARYGGEEFAFLLPQTAKAEAFTLAERVCAAVARRDWDAAAALPGGRLTISLGVASFPGDATSHAELLQRADQALYLAKNQGRNRVQAWQAMN